LRVAALSFGGPAGQIAVMHRILVEEKRWIGEQRFLHALNYCMVLPGPEAQQLATYIGWLLHGTRGGLVAGSLFVLPGFLSILALSVLYAGFSDLTVVDGLFFGVQAAVLAVVVQALVRIGRRALRNARMIAIAAAAFVAIFFLTLPFPLIIVTAAGIGLLESRFDRAHFAMSSGHGSGAGSDASDEASEIDGEPAEPSLRRALTVSAIWLSLWFVPLIAIVVLLGTDHVFAEIGIFFSKLAVVTFGGAYAVLAYMAQAAVEQYHWLDPGEMLDGLGMAESTPGPLIQVVQFVAFMGAFRDAGALDPYVAGTIASVLATWVTFVPCFLWIFLGAPYVERLHDNRAIAASLSAITAAVVGVMLNLAAWFAVHVLFASVREERLYGVRWLIPDLGTVEPMSLVLASAAAIGLIRYKVGVLYVLGAAAGIGMLYRLSVVGG
jgi:chromate transporter